MDFTNPVNNLIRAFIPIPRQYLPKETNRHRAAAQYGRGLQARLQAASVLAFRPVLLAAALRAADVDACDDHRIAFLAVALALAAPGTSRVHGFEAITKSFPGYLDAIHALLGPAAGRCRIVQERT